MADVNKPKFQLRTGLSINGDKTPSPATKLLISHGKPNFTIPRSTKTQNANGNCLSPTPASACHVQNNSNEFVVKSNTFNGVFKPSYISAAAKYTVPPSGNTNIKSGDENEANRVILRRPKFVPTQRRDESDDDNVPEFIRRQRRIQERLANQNILDFENRRSGYFTQVLISPLSPNRQSFVETMASPAIKPGLEMPATAAQNEDTKVVTPHPESDNEQHGENDNEKRKEIVLEEPATFINQIEEEEVAKAIEEVNKAVEGEDDDKIESEVHAKSEHGLAFNSGQIEETTLQTKENHQELATLENSYAEAQITGEIVEQAASLYNGHSESEVTPASITESALKMSDSNSIGEEQPISNGHSDEKSFDNGITISHTNGINGPRLPTPDPKGEKGVNFESKTVVSFSQELGNGDNKYPDTVKVIKDVENLEVDSALKELSKLKFEINAKDQDIEIKPIIATETS